MALFIIFAVAAIAIAVYSFIQTKKLINSEMIDVDFKSVVYKTLIYNAAFAAAFTVMLVGGMLWGNFPCDGLHWFKLIAGGLCFGFSIMTAIHFFVFFYYGRNIEEVWKKKIYYSFIGLFIAAFLTMFLFLDGYAPYLEYPIISKLNFQKGFINPTETYSGLTITFYAICILSGAILVYFMCDHFMYKEYGKHGILESTFYVAFPAGIIGARIWYCIGMGKPLSEWIRIWDGGITILGGAVMGILVGVLWFLWRNKKYSIWIAVDCIVPTILIAQAVGRFGNFFNCEVHGLEVSQEYFKWLPEIIRNNMTYSSTVSYAAAGNMFVPLFFIEALVNFFGYFFIAHLLGKRFNKVLEPGDLALSYIVWYGLTRVILEPFRHGNYNMGGNGYWSWFWSLTYVFVGVLGIIANHIVRYILKKRKNNYIVLKGDQTLSIAEFAAFTVAGIILLVFAIIMISTNTFTGKIGFDGFNIGIMLLILGCSVLLFDVPAAIRFIEARKIKQNA